MAALFFSDFYAMNKNSFSSVEKFENHIKNNLLKNGFDLSLLAKQGLCAGAAVSGGADSVSLLIALAHLSKKYGFCVKVITVNHNIRDQKESRADADFVLSVANALCSQGFCVSAAIKEIARGKVFEVAEKRKNGTEEAARFLRYQAFEDFFSSEKLAFLALAHNQNDQTETLLMRFLQGSGTAGLCGISSQRDFYVRPLLDVSRKKIEEYLTAQNVQWRTDLTNFDTNYLRNRIRQKLVPFLSENFPGFEKALQSGSEKAVSDEHFISSFVEKSFWTIEKNSVYVSLRKFIDLHNAVKIRQVYAALGLLKAGSRVPFVVVKKFIENISSEKKLEGKKKIDITFSDIVFFADNEKIGIKKNEIVATDSCFFVIIEKDICFSVFSFNVEVHIVEERAQVSIASEKDKVLLEDVPIPFCIRSRQQNDFVRTSGGGKKSVSDILSDWHVCAEKKSSVPVVQELYSKNQEILAVCGSVLGFKNWIVTET